MLSASGDFRKHSKQYNCFRRGSAPEPAGEAYDPPQTRSRLGGDSLQSTVSDGHFLLAYARTNLTPLATIWFSVWQMPPSVYQEIGFMKFAKFVLKFVTVYFPFFVALHKHNALMRDYVNVNGIVNL